MVKGDVRQSNQNVGNAGLFYVCFELTKRGWNVLPTSRNARGIDIVAYSHDGTRTITIQVKSLSRRSPVPFGSNMDSMIAEYIVVCRSVFSDKPECFIAKKDNMLMKIHKGENEGRISYWLAPRDYEVFKNQWELIGDG